MQTALLIIFALTYLAVALESVLKVNKAISALVGATVMWVVYASSQPHWMPVCQALWGSSKSITKIIFFLVAAMAVVEVITARDGFRFITKRIKTQDMPTLLWQVAWVTFFFSAILDNLTTTIVMVSLVKNLLAEREDRLLFSGIIIIAANAGGAWTPIGDITTTMLWLGGQVTALNIMVSLLFASAVNLALPLTLVSLGMRGQAVCPPTSKYAEPRQQRLNLMQTLARIDLGTIVFFIGILLAVAVLEHAHILTILAHNLLDTVGRLDVIVLIIGAVSAVVDNVPLVAAAMGMFSLTHYPRDSFIWEFLAYCCGTGGSMLVIGSAAGVAAMGLEKIDFMWYAKKFGGLALLGYLAGALCYILQYRLLALIRV